MDPAGNQWHFWVTDGGRPKSFGTVSGGQNPEGGARSVSQRGTY